MHANIIIKSKAIYESTKSQETIIFNAHTGEFFGVQDTSEIIWKLIDGTRNMNMIIDELLAMYDNISRECIESDVEEMLNILREKGVII